MPPPAEKTVKPKEPKKKPAYSIRPTTNRAGVGVSAYLPPRPSKRQELLESIVGKKKK